MVATTVATSWEWGSYASTDPDSFTLSISTNSGSVNCGIGPIFNFFEVGSSYFTSAGGLHIDGRDLYQNPESDDPDIKDKTFLTLYSVDFEFTANTHTIHRKCSSRLAISMRR